MAPSIVADVIKGMVLAAKIFEDMGFGEFFAPSGFRVEKIIELGGSNGQFNSLS